MPQDKFGGGAAGEDNCLYSTTSCPSTFTTSNWPIYSLSSDIRWIHNIEVNACDCYNAQKDRDLLHVLRVVRLSSCE
jgi:hypothetical protein